MFTRLLGSLAMCFVAVLLLAGTIGTLALGFLLPFSLPLGIVLTAVVGLLWYLKHGFTLLLGRYHAWLDSM